MLHCAYLPPSSSAAQESRGVFKEGTERWCRRRSITPLGCVPASGSAYTGQIEVAGVPAGISQAIIPLPDERASAFGS